MSDFTTLELMEKKLNADFFEAVTPEDFLPPISLWTSVGGMVMLTTVVVAVAAASVFQYQVIVKTPAKIRPEGELRLVQTSKSGKVHQIIAKVNQEVKQGDIIAYLDDSQLQQERKQLQKKINSIQRQLEQITQQIKTKESQIIAEVDQINKNIASLQAELILTQDNYQNKKIIRIAELKQAEANFNFTRDELARYQQLAHTGAISELRLSEKKASYDIAEARLQKAKDQINPSAAEITVLKEKIAQETAKGKATLALLQQETQQLEQRQVELIAQLDSNLQEQAKLATDIEQMIIRSSTSGTIQELNLRNSGQVLQKGDGIAKISPSASDLVIKTAVAVSDIERVRLDQAVQIRVSSCPYTDYGTLKGKVIAISPDVISTPTNPRDYVLNNHYEVTVQPENLVLSNSQQQCEIKSGMDGQAEIITQKETILKFVLRKARLWVNL